MLEETVVSPLAFLVNMLAMVALGALGGRGTCSLATLCTSVRNVRAFLGMAADALSFNMKAKISIPRIRQPCNMAAMRLSSSSE